MKTVKPMKTKAFIAKLLVLCMIVGLLPVVALAVHNDAPVDEPYYTINADVSAGGTVTVYYKVAGDAEGYYTVTDTGETPDWSYYVASDAITFMVTKIVVSPTSYYGVSRGQFTLGGHTEELTAGDNEIEDGTFSATNITANIRVDFIPTYIPGPSFGGGTTTTEYTVTVQNTDPNGEVTLSDTSAAPGDIVGVHVKPHAGYRTGSVVVTDRNGNPVKVKPNLDGTYSFEMPQGGVTVKVTFVPALVADEVFSDLKGDYADKYIEYMLNHAMSGLLTGYDDGTFKPDVLTSRVMMWQMIANMNGVERPEGMGYREFASTYAKENGISDGTNADQDLTREQMITMLYNSFGTKVTGTVDMSDFTDAGDIHSYCADAMNWAISTGLVHGFDGKLDPRGTATREQLITFIAIYLQSIEAD